MVSFETIYNSGTYRDDLYFRCKTYNTDKYNYIRIADEFEEYKFHPDLNKVYIVDDGSKIEEILKKIYDYKADLCIYFYPDDKKSVSYNVKKISDLVSSRNEFFDYIISTFGTCTKYMYFKESSASTYFLRIEYLYYKEDKTSSERKDSKHKTPILAKDLKNTTMTTIKEKGDKNYMMKTNDLFTFEKISAKMDITSGQLVLDSDGHYFENGQVMQTVPEMCMDMDAFMISTPVVQLKVADIVNYGGQFVYITKISGAAIDGITLKGEYVAFQVPTHKFFGKSMQMLPKVVSLFENFSGGADFNPMMLMLLKDDNKDSDIFKMMMLGQMFQNMGKDKE